MIFNNMTELKPYLLIISINVNGLTLLKVKKKFRLVHKAKPTFVLFIGDLHKWKDSERVKIQGWTKINQIKKKVGVSFLVFYKGRMQIRKHYRRQKDTL